MQIRQSTARNVMVLMVDATDHITGKTGLTLTVTASKDGAAFSSITPAVTERGNGWYSLALTTGHTDTLGDLALHLTATGADPADLRIEVVANLVGAAATLAAGAITTGTFGAGTIDSMASASAGAVRTELALELGRIDAATTTRLASAGYTAPPSATTVAGAVRTELTVELGRVDVATSTRLAAASYATPPAAAAVAGAVRAELTPELGRIDVPTSTRLAAGAYATPPSSGQIADAVQGRSLTVGTVADKTGYSLSGAGVTAVQSGVATAASQASILAALGALEAAVAEIEGLSPAAVRAAVEAALAEARELPSGAPPAQASIVRMLGHLYLLGRNEVRQNDATQAVLNDDGSPNVEATVSNDGVFIRGRWEAA